VMHGTFEASTEIWDIGINFPIVGFKMRLSRGDLAVGSLTLLLIYPLWLLRLSRITEYEKIQTLSSDWREHANAGNRLAEFLSARYPRTLDIDSVSNEKFRSEH